MGKSIKQARNKLALSKLDGQRELIAHDLDLSQLAFITRKLPVMRFDEAVIDADVVRTIEGASTVTIKVNDHYGIIRRSGRLARFVDIKIDGLWFRLVKVKKRGDDIDLTFESREVAVLRTYNARRVVGWGKMRRSRFVQILVQEPKEFDIPFICPDLQKPKQVKTKAQKAVDRDPGFGFNTDQGRQDLPLGIRRGTGGVAPESRLPSGGIQIKGKPASANQLRNLEQVLDVGVAMLVKRKLLVCAVMTVIQESTANNLPFGHGTSVGMFQEIDIWGSVQERMNIPHASRRFFNKVIAYDEDHPKADYAEVCQAAQRSAFPRAYAQWRTEAEKIVTAYGVAGGDISLSSDIAGANNMVPEEFDFETGIGEFQFMRGRPKVLPGGKKGWEKEDTWTCIQRLADEVNWRCFEVSGKVYFTTETHLFKSAPRMRISEDSPGIDWIDFDYDVGKKNAQVDVSCRMDRWVAPPGTIIEVIDSGVANGRWIVTEIRRSLFSNTGTIIAKKPRPRFPEPKKEDLTGLWDNVSNVDTGEYVPTPGWVPDAPGNLPKGKALRDAVLNSSSITFTRPSQQQDISMGLIDPKVLRFLIAFTEAGFHATISALRTDHGKFSRPGVVSDHYKGLAVDISNYTDQNLPRTRLAMNWIADNRIELQLSQLIGPIDELVIPLGHYGSTTLEQHDNHLHVAF